MSALSALRSPGHFVELFLRDVVDTCEADNEYNGEHYAARISSVFVVLVASAFGSFFPVLSSRYSFIRMPPVCFFIAKFFGSGVIIATAFIHLLEPASDNLSNECLGYPFTVYPFAFGICLIVLMLMFFLEIIAYRWVEAKMSNQQIDLNEPHTHSHFGEASMFVNGEEHHHTQHPMSDIDATREEEDEIQLVHYGVENAENHTHAHHTHTSHSHSHSHTVPSGEPHEHLTESLSSSHDVDANVDLDLDLEEKKVSMLEEDNSVVDDDLERQDINVSPESLADFTGQLLNVFILEFGIIFHSVFVGLTLACSGDEFVSLYIVVCFHQMFEGLGLGTRVACVDWPRSKRWTPWMLCLGYTISTPIAIGIGIGVRDSYPPGSRTALITNGVFDSISAGILVYTGLVELMAHEFLFSDEFKGAGGFKKMLWAYLVMCTGAGLMALLGRWA